VWEQKNADRLKRPYTSDALARRILRHSSTRYSS
jgi:hypothetical protein